MNVVDIAALSDTHGSAPQGPFSARELLLHGGDFTADGSFHQLHLAGLRLSRHYPGHWIGTCGNHDLLFERSPDIARQALGGTVLIDQLTQASGLRIWGCPWTLPYGNYAFMASEADLWRQLRGARIERPDVLISHGPPLGILDQTVTGTHVGSQALLDTITEAKPALVICGHIHEAAGIHRLNWGDSSTLIVNAASRAGVSTRVTLTEMEGGYFAAPR